VWAIWKIKDFLEVNVGGNIGNHGNVRNSRNYEEDGQYNNNKGIGKDKDKQIFLV